MLVSGTYVFAFDFGSRPSSWDLMVPEKGTSTPRSSSEALSMLALIWSRERERERAVSAPGYTKQDHCKWRISCLVLSPQGLKLPGEEGYRLLFVLPLNLVLAVLAVEEVEGEVCGHDVLRPAGRRSHIQQLANHLGGFLLLKEQLLFIGVEKKINEAEGA